MITDCLKIPVPLIVGLLIIVFDMNFIQESEYVAEIEYESEYETEPPVLIIKGFFINNTGSEIEAEYSLSVLKNSSAGVANSDQKGSFNAPPGEKAFLTKSVISIDEGADYKVTLKITEKNKFIAIKSINLKEPEF